MTRAASVTGFGLKKKFNVAHAGGVQAPAATIFMFSFLG